MFLLMLMLNILSAQEMQLEFNDWNYDTKIEIDSLNIRNIGLGIDTPLINPKNVDITSLLIFNDVEQDKIKDFSLNYSQNNLNINSKEIIQSIKIVDILGKTILESTPNSTQFTKNITLQENLTFVILTINNKTYSQKLYNINEDFYKSPSVIMNDESTWLFTPYKERYRDTTYTFQNYQFKETLNLDLKRERYLVSISTSNVIIKRNYNRFIDNPITGESTTENKDSYYERTFSISLVLFETKYNSFNVYSICPEERYYYNSNGFFNINWDKDRNNYNNNYIQLNNNSLSNFYNFNSTNNTYAFTDCDYDLFRYSLPQSIDLFSITNQVYNNEIEGQLEYIYKLQRNSRHHDYLAITETISSLNGSTTTLTIQKLD